ncbi:MAG: nickel pincer cofactor biosynthesis protein LarC [Candidatus Nanoarchaeia archaeon]|nr:nickel pincer cofactor biosynthesis protein LarC [Candidatus Nanoarchaeia archaeon]
MKALYFNCMSGISGDMTVASLLDLEDNKNYLVQELKKLNLKNYNIKISKVKKINQIATRFEVITGEEHIHRHLNDIFSILDNSLLSLEVKELSKKIFYELGKAEAIVHNTSINEVHFHEVGALDSIIDIVSASIIIKKLGIKDVYCSPISEGYGKIRIQHGEVNLPVPAVRQLLHGFPMKLLKINKELTTPTGAAIIKTLCKEVINPSQFKALKQGYGAGKKDFPFPNVLQASVGTLNKDCEDELIIETNIDDMNPEIFPYLIEKLIYEGAIDAFIVPCHMKKNRIGFLLSVLCTKKEKDKLIKTIFEETTSFGLRINKLERVKLNREIRKVKTRYGIINMKIGCYKGKIVSSKPEFEDCKKLAIKHKIPLKSVYEEIKKKLDF